MSINANVRNSLVEFDVENQAEARSNVGVTQKLLRPLIRFLLQFSRTRTRRGQSSDKTIETFRPGYPRFSALISSHPAFQICRQFARTRMRLLLLKQDEITVLEKELDNSDDKETKELFLVSCRRDRNADRKNIIQTLETKLAEYGRKPFVIEESWASANKANFTDALLDRNRRILSLNTASTRDVQSLQNWVEGTCCLSYKESAFLNDNDDLVKLVDPVDEAISRLEPIIEDILRYVWKWIGKKPQRTWTSDPHVFIPSGSHVTTIARVAIAFQAIVLLLVPSLILNTIKSSYGRAVIISVAVAIFILLISTFSKARTAEVFAVGATYAAVLVVFVSGNPSLLGIG